MLTLHRDVLTKPRWAVLDAAGYVGSIHQMEASYGPHDSGEVSLIQLPVGLPLDASLAFMETGGRQHAELRFDLTENGGNESISMETGGSQQAEVRFDFTGNGGNDAISMEIQSEPSINLVRSGENNTLLPTFNNITAAVPVAEKQGMTSQKDCLSLNEAVDMNGPTTPKPPPLPTSYELKNGRKRKRLNCSMTGSPSIERCLSPLDRKIQTFMDTYTSKLRSSVRTSTLSGEPGPKSKKLIYE